jgi:hypothetical protein
MSPRTFSDSLEIAFAKSPCAAMRENGFFVGIYALNADKITGLTDWPVAR